MEAKPLRLIRDTDVPEVAAPAGAAGTGLLEAMLEAWEASATPAPETVPPAPNGPLTVRILAFNAAGSPLVEIHHQDWMHVAEARSLVPITGDLRGRSALALFEAGDLRRPILLGLLQAEAGGAQAAPVLPAAGRVQVRMDGKVLTLEAAEEISLVCGKASIRLSRDGRIVLRGTDLLSRASGTNKIKGGAVHLN